MIRTLKHKLQLMHYNSFYYAYQAAAFLRSKKLMAYVDRKAQHAYPIGVYMPVDHPF